LSRIWKKAVFSRNSGEARFRRKDGNLDSSTKLLRTSQSRPSALKNQEYRRAICSLRMMKCWEIDRD
jgi:hypothetical protein